MKQKPSCQKRTWQVPKNDSRERWSSEQGCIRGDEIVDCHRSHEDKENAVPQVQWDSQIHFIYFVLEQRDLHSYY